MKCPYCGYKESRVVDSRPADEGSSIRRRRECLACERRFTTYETMESLPMVVIKKDGSRQSFDRSKILHSMIRACEKRTVPLARLEKITDEIEQNLQNNLEREITTDMVGEQVMESSGRWTRWPTSASPPSTGSSRTSTPSWRSSPSCWRRSSGY